MRGPDTRRVSPHVRLPGRHERFLMVLTVDEARSECLVKRRDSGRVSLQQRTVSQEHIGINKQQL